jgi:hypothetical protein
MRGGRQITRTCDALKSGGDNARMDHRIDRADVEDLATFDRLQRLHLAACPCIEDRLGELSAGMRALTVLFAFVGGVDNGGFSSAMYNSTGDLTAEAIAAADLIGATPHAAIFREFAEIGLGGDLTLDSDARNARLEAMSDAEAAALEMLDEPFFALPSIDEYLASYVDRYAGEFFRG